MISYILIFYSLFMIQDNSNLIFEASNKEDISKWYVVDDGVMGGVSEGTITMNTSKNLLFTGQVRLENNGGFSSIRYNFETKQVKQYQYVVLRLKGDGKEYQFRIKEDRQQRYSYIQSFKTSGEWQTIKLPLDEFYAGFRGNKLKIPNYAGLEMDEIAILIGNKRKESFSLEIDKIYLE
ncbi:CIA30 family protein [Jejudonia soesokkakensis]|uniref:CIA30 family protein n=1 Tax=Jejudonia soesokkakensis TaxID=1323432 RepID=A0ABW2MU44_9FLAO